MSRYNWPRDTRGKEPDDPRGRAGFLTPRRTDFDPVGAREAGRALPAPQGPVHGPRAPQSGRMHLWQPLGPLTVIRGQAIGDPRIAGRVNALALDTIGTLDPVTGIHVYAPRVYAASGNGGIWYSDNNGAHWRSLGGFAPTNAAEVNRPAQRNSCGTIHVKFGATESQDDVYVGTGEAASQRVDLPRNAQPGISLGGIGILFARGPAASTSDDPWQREADNLIGHGVNRIVLEPGGTNVIAATTRGLYQRPAAPGPNVDWEHIGGEPFSDLEDECTDVLWTAGAGPAPGARPARLWVWVRNGDHAGLWVRPQGATDFTPIATPGSFNTNAVMAASDPPDQIFLFNDDGGGGAPVLFRIEASTDATPAATFVAGVPDVLQTQGFYDIAIAVDPTSPNHIVLGGCTFSSATPDGTAVNDAAVVTGDVALVAGVLTFTNPRMIGVGVHADVHDVKYSDGGARIWASCDGGVYRSDHPTELAGFYSRNDGLSIIESNYVANHSACEGYVVTGLQDNGVIERLSSGVWKVKEGGDGGSVVFDPVLPTRFISQYVRGIWRASDGSFRWNSANNLISRAGVLSNRENDASAFYSTAAAIKQTRGATTVGQIIAGTTRVWYTENFGGPWTGGPPATIRWVTLPTGTDPLQTGDRDQDTFTNVTPPKFEDGEKITVCRWQSPDVAWILGEGHLMRYSRTPNSDSAGGPGAWTRETIIKKGLKNKKQPTTADGPIVNSAVWTDIAVNLDSPTTAHGPKGALYLGTIGNPDSELVDTLWWFDGTSKWWRTGLRIDPTTGHARVPAPVTAIVCDPAFPNEVYVGTTIGVWKGIRTQVGDAVPTWAWESRVNGLPEAAVEDLAIFSDGTLRLLRAAIAARGTWELRLDMPDVQDLAYLRVHDDDLRYRLPVTEKRRDLDPVRMRSWHGSPDIRPREAPRDMPVPATLTNAHPWQFSTFNTTLPTPPPTDQQKRELRRFQATLRAKSGDPRVRPTGTWDTYFNEVIRNLPAPHNAPLIAGSTVGITPAYWTSTMVAPHTTAEPWGADPPLEADLYDFVDEIQEGDLDQAHCSLPSRPAKVEIVVHFRGLHELNGDNVRVTLLWWKDPAPAHKAKWNDLSTWPTIKPGPPTTVGWTSAVNEVLNSADGKTAQALPAGWHFSLGNNTQSHRITLAGQMLDPLHSGIAKFDLNLSGPGFPSNTLVLLVAVIHTPTIPNPNNPANPTNIALAEGTLKNLALTQPNMAVRSLKIS